jgi:glycosyltransferase involved in cell wall biosynthesis
MRSEGVSNRKLRGLWIARQLPFPLDSGDKVYSAYLSRAVADAGADLTMLGMAPEAPTNAPCDWPIHWVIVPGRPRSKLRSLCHVMPLVAAAHATVAYRSAVSRLLNEAWDFVVFDQYGMGWALAEFRKSSQTTGTAPVIVHVAHDHESSLSAALYRQFRGSWLKRIVLWQNHLKTRALERKVALGSDLIASITENDAALFAIDAPRSSIVVIKPGYCGTRSSRSVITQQVPRHVVMVGSFHWVAKQENLRQFIAVADPLFAQHGIEMHIIGQVPERFATEIRRTVRATFMHGFVENIQSHFEQARIAIVPEAIGGGFKLKILDYIFGGVPVATLTAAAAGLGPELRSAMLCCNDIFSLANSVCALMDDLNELNRMRAEALAKAETLFRWEDRGRALIEAIMATRELTRLRGLARASDAIPAPPSAHRS